MCSRKQQYWTDREAHEIWSCETLKSRFPFSENQNCRLYSFQSMSSDILPQIELKLCEPSLVSYPQVIQNCSSVRLHLLEIWQSYYTCEIYCWDFRISTETQSVLSILNLIFEHKTKHLFIISRGFFLFFPLLSLWGIH
jgi:hypothetical protein